MVGTVYSMGEHPKCRANAPKSTAWITIAGELIGIDSAQVELIPFESGQKITAHGYHTWYEAVILNVLPDKLCVRTLLSGKPIWIKYDDVRPHGFNNGFNE